MKKNLEQFISNNKGFVVFYLIWFLLHLIFISVGDRHDGFWPFSTEYQYNNTILYDYGIIEFIFYLISPIVIWALWKLIGKDVKDKY